MEYISTLDNKIESILNNNIFYSVLIIGLIVYCTFISNKQTNPYVNIKLSNLFVKILMILSILYFATKDIRMSLLLLIIFLLELDKLNMEEINGELIALMITDSMLEERIQKLEKK